MKNKYYEYLRQKRKEYIKSNKFIEKQFNKNGLAVYHIYDDNVQKNLSWWDDVGFKMGKQYYVVWWTHPRMKYADLSEDIAHNVVDDLYGKMSGDFFSDSTKNFKKVGKSRKKVMSYTCNTNRGDAESNWYDEFQKARDDTLFNGSVVAVPSFKITPLAYGKGIDICYPMEVRNEADLKTLVDLVKRLLRCECKLSDLVGDYKYSRDEWMSENNKDDVK